MAKRQRKSFAMTPSDRTNLWKLGRSARIARAGDVFLANMRGERWLFGRVVCTDSKLGNFDDTILVYIYSHFIDDPAHVQLPIAPLLLVPPVGVDCYMWNAGFFRHILESNFVSEELLPRHVFKVPTDSFTLPQGYVDEYRRPVSAPGPGEWCKAEGRSMYGAVDDMLSEALNIPKFR